MPFSLGVQYFSLVRDWAYWSLASGSYSISVLCSTVRDTGGNSHSCELAGARTLFRVMPLFKSILQTFWIIETHAEMWHVGFVAFLWLFSPKTEIAVVECINLLLIRETTPRSLGRKRIAKMGLLLWVLGISSAFVFVPLETSTCCYNILSQKQKTEGGT